MNKENIKARLQILLERYNQTTRLEAKENVSEETIRTWLNEFALPVHTEKLAEQFITHG